MKINQSAKMLTPSPLVNLEAWRGVRQKLLRRRVLRGAMDVKVEGRDCVSVELTKGQWALIDKEDEPMVRQFNWQAEKASNGFYAMTTRSLKGKTVKLRMHRLILGEDFHDCDHVNRNPLDNRRSNLRGATRSHNVANSCGQANSSSRYKGVSKLKDGWHAKIVCGGSRFYLGTFNIEEDAARAYDVAAITLFGEYARINLKPPAFASGRTCIVCPSCNGDGTVVKPENNFKSTSKQTTPESIGAVKL